MGMDSKCPRLERRIFHIATVNTLWVMLVIMTTRDRRKILSRSPKPSRWLISGLFLLTLSGPLAIGWLARLGCNPFSVNDASARVLTGLLAGPAFAILGVLILVYRPHNRIGWLSHGIAFCLPGSIAIDLYALCGLDGTIAAPGKEYAAWFLYSYGPFFVIPLVILLPLLFPTGRFLSSRYRSVALISLTAMFIMGTALGLNFDLSQSGVMYFYPLKNPLGRLALPAWWPQVMSAINNLNFAGLRLFAVAAIVVRFRRSVGDERQQMKWLTYFLALAFGVTVLFFNLPAHIFSLPTIGNVWFALMITVSFLGIPIVIGITIFKYRLYDIDLIINRTLVYGGLTLVVLLIYTLIVGGSGATFSNIRKLNHLPSGNGPDCHRLSTGTRKTATDGQPAHVWSAGRSLRCPLPPEPAVTDHGGAQPNADLDCANDCRRAEAALRRH